MDGSANFRPVIEHGIDVTSAFPALSGDTISGNGGYGLYYSGSIPISATNNNWGDPSGPTEPSGNPTGTGDKISISGANVDYTPFLTTRPALCAPALAAGSPSMDFGTKIIGFSAPQLLSRVGSWLPIFKTYMSPRR